MTDLIFEHKGQAVIVQHCKLHGDLKHAGRDVQVRLAHSDGQQALSFSYTESRFRAPVHFSIVPDGIRYCEILAHDGTRLFDSRTIIACEPAPVAIRPVVQEGPDGRRPHPRHFREERNK